MIRLIVASIGRTVSTMYRSTPTITRIMITLISGMSTLLSAPSSLLTFSPRAPRKARPDDLHARTRFACTQYSADQLGGRRDVHLREHHAAVPLHGADTDVQRRRDLL